MIKVIITRKLALITDKNRIKSLTSYLKETLGSYIEDSTMVSYDIESVKGITAEEAFDRKEVLIDNIDLIVDKYGYIHDDVEDLAKYLSEVRGENLILLMDIDEDVEEI